MDTCPKLDIDFSKFTNVAFSIGDHAFASTGCTKFNPSTCTYIGNEVFVNCNKLKTIDFTKYNVPKTTRIDVGMAVFKGCSIDKILLPQDDDFIWGFATNVGENGWVLVDTKNNNNFSLTNNSVAIAGLAKGNIKINDDSLTKIAPYTFIGSEITGFECQTIKEIGENAFSECVNLKNIDFTTFTNLEKIGKQAFLKCNEIKKIDFSKSTKLLAILEEAFSGDARVNELILPSSLKTIGKEAFKQTNLTRIVWCGLSSDPIPETTGSINSMAFCYIPKTGKIKLEPNIDSYTSEDLLNYFKTNFYITYDAGKKYTFQNWETE